MMLSSTGVSLVNASDVAFHENASDIMITSLQGQPQHHFLKALYKQLFFVPIWIDENSLSPLSDALFSSMKKDVTLRKESRLYQDMLALEQKAEAVYDDSNTLIEKVDLEFKISQLYKGYADHTLYGSINWGAFKNRLYNLKVRDINAAWVTYKPQASPISLLEQAVLGGDLERLFSQAMPTEYHYKALLEALERYRAIQKKWWVEALAV